MTIGERARAIRTIADYYGTEHQKQKAVEELAELIVAIEKNNEKAIREEMADVIIMIDQLKYLCEINTADMEVYKLNRQLGRIDRR